MHRIRTLAVAITAAVFVATAAPVAAEHEHWLQTPGTCVEDIARGQTSKTAEVGGGHKFHENVHAGQPGNTTDGAFLNGPVSVGKGTCPSEEVGDSH